MANNEIVVQGATIKVTDKDHQDYICLTDMVANFEGGSSLIDNWLRNKNTIEFLGVWEKINNKSFNSLEFEGIKNQPIFPSDRFVRTIKPLEINSSSNPYTASRPDFLAVSSVVLISSATLTDQLSGFDSK